MRVLRALFVLLSLTALGALLYLRQSDGDTTDLLTGEPLNAEPGFSALHGRLIETGDNGHPLFRLDADKIEQPSPEGIVYLTSPRIDYQPGSGNHWTLTALEGQLPQDASSADLTGNVHAEGLPGTSDSLMRIDCDVLHLDMQKQIATTPGQVRVVWAGRTLHGRGLRYEMQRTYLELYTDIHAALSR
ncbi:MAG TPA: LPS export ABC transporter periplasmic protein LptC [Steroidobacteraceae bacterium]|jgi:LPS export ABC transporter protein LptC|nr:LPS export ABC transporter periplasmic protein LptC [Steroidobacteraceae bacterium]